MDKDGLNDAFDSQPPSPDFVRGAGGQGDFKDTPLGLLPKEWETTLLKEVAEIRSGGSAPQGEIYFQGSLPFVRVQHIDHDTDFVKRWDLITEKAILKYKLKLFPKGAILFPKSGASIRLEKRAILPVDAYVVSHLCAILPFEGLVHPRFLFYVLKHIRFSDNKADGYPSLNLTEIGAELIPLPPLPEQRAIAHVLSTVREAIEATERVIAAARQLKRSLMKHLFTYGPVPIDQADQVPLKETEFGNVPENWDVVPVGSICRSIVPGRDKPKRFDGSIPWITMPDIRWRNYVDHSTSGLALSKEAIEEVRGKIIPKGSVIMSCVGEFGFTTIAEREIVINQQLHAFVCPDNLDPFFLSHALQLQKSYMERIAHFTTIAYMSKDKCNSVPIPYPSISDQRAISKHLKAVDEKIAIEDQRKTALEVLFNSLLHHLMAGKVRVV